MEAVYSAAPRAEGAVGCQGWSLLVARGRCRARCNRGEKPHRSRCCLIFSALVSPALARKAARTCGEKRVSHEHVRPREGRACSRMPAAGTPCLAARYAARRRLSRYSCARAGASDARAQTRCDAATRLERVAQQLFHPAPCGGAMGAESGADGERRLAPQAGRACRYDARRLPASRGRSVGGHVRDWGAGARGGGGGAGKQVRAPKAAARVTSPFPARCGASARRSAQPPRMHGRLQRASAARSGRGCGSARRNI